MLHTGLVATHVASASTMLGLVERTESGGVVRRIIAVSVLQHLDTTAASVIRLAAPLHN